MYRRERPKRAHAVTDKLLDMLEGEIKRVIASFEVILGKNTI